MTEKTFRMHSGEAPAFEQHIDAQGEQITHARFTREPDPQWGRWKVKGSDQAIQALDTAYDAIESWLKE